MQIPSFLKRMRLSAPKSLKTRTTLIVAAVTLFAALSITVSATAVLKIGMKDSVSRDQFARITDIAKSIDQKFTSREIALQAIAQIIRDLPKKDSASLQAALVAHREFKQLFDSFSVLNASGDLMANFNDATRIGKLNVSDRPYFYDTMRTKRGVIGQPIENRLTHKAQVVMTHPVFDEEGNVVFVVTGGINLEEDNFLGELATTKFGKTGYLFILNTDAIVVHHPRKNRILKHDAADGSRNLASEKALEGFEGTAEALNRYGIYGFYAFKRTLKTNWIVSSVYPESEALAAVDAMFYKALGTALILTILASLVTWRLVRRELLPLESLHAHMRETAGAIEYTPLKSDTTTVEIADLSNTFNNLMLERQRSVEQIAQSESYLKEVLSHAGDAFVSIDADGLITEWNRQAEETFGWTRAEAIAKSVSELLIPIEQRAAHLAGMERFRKSGTGPIINQRLEVMAMHRDAHRIPVEMTISAVEKNGKFTANAFLRDISDRMEAEQTLASSERRLRMVTDNMPALISYVDKNMVYRFANAHYEKMLGMPPEEIVGREVRAIYGEENYAQIAKHITMVLAGNPVHFERAQYLDSKISHLAVDFIPDFASDGEVVGTYVMGLDITARKEAELRQQESEERLRTVANNLPSKIAYIDPDERYIFVNQELALTVGSTVEKLIGKTVAETSAAAIYSAWGPHIKAALGGKRVNFESEVSLDGQSHFFYSKYLPALDKSGTIVGCYLMTIDITDRRRVEILKSEFVSTVSHEIRTPLTSIKGALGLLIGGTVGAFPEAAGRMLDVAQRNVDRLIRLVNDMLDVEKIETGRMDFHTQVTNVGLLAQTAIDTTVDMANSSGIKLTLHLVAGEPPVVLADEDRLVQVLVNLLSNAIKFSADDSEVVTRIEVLGKKVRISVVDSGIGIPEKHRGKIFQKFSQVDASSTKPKGGSGLGLNICKAIVEHMGGEIEFEANVTGGTTFLVHLPLWDGIAAGT